MDGGSGGLGYYAYVTDPRDNVIAVDLRSSAGTHLDSTFAFEATSSGDFTCAADFLVADVSGGNASQTRLVNLCGDQRGEMIAEYQRPATRVNWTPMCDDFRTGLPSVPSNFSWDVWNQDNDYKQAESYWGILQPVVVGNLYCVLYNYGSVRPLTSGYRNPVRQLQISNNNGSAFPAGGRHMFGDAADVDTPNGPNDAEWLQLRAIAKSGECAVACVEPRIISQNHFHVDYRGVCPNSNW